MNTPVVARERYELGVPLLSAGQTIGSRYSKNLTFALPTDRKSKVSVFVESVEGEFFFDVQGSPDGSARTFTAVSITGAAGTATATFQSGEGALAELVAGDTVIVSSASKLFTGNVTVLSVAGDTFTFAWNAEGTDPDCQVTPTSLHQVPAQPYATLLPSAPVKVVNKGTAPVQVVDDCPPYIRICLGAETPPEGIHSGLQARVYFLVYPTSPLSQDNI